MTKQIHFYKYQGTGNDFVITSDIFDITKEQIQALCNRKYGIGSDGLIVMRKESKFDFEMIYYNADGSESFCGNGSRCAVMHAKSIGWITNDCTFGSNDGPHEARIEDEIVFLKMHNVDMVLVEDEGYMLNTGSPHYIAYTEEIDALDLIEAAHAIRYSERFEETGINVNYLEARNGVLYIRTYERGVEDETLSCGTGVTAAAIAHYLEQDSSIRHFSQKIQTKGGPLMVSFDKKPKSFENIFLSGPAVKVFEGDVML